MIIIGSYSVDLTGVAEIGYNALAYALYGCDVSIGENSTYCAPFATGTNVIATNMSMQHMFDSCHFLNTSFSFQGITELGVRFGDKMFYNTDVQKIYFHGLTAINSGAFGSNSTYYTFGSANALTEIHFPAALQADVEAMSGYSAKWGATNATIYFDL